MKNVLKLVLVLAFVSIARADAADWPHWRGPHDNGSVNEGNYPVQWDANHVSWRVPLPGKGSSTPVVWDKRIFLTAPAEGQDAVMAFDWQGKMLWQTPLGQAKTGKHPASSSCNPSAVTDGQGVFAIFNSGTLAGLDLDGTVRWKTNLVDRFGPETRFFDPGTSPALTDKAVICSRIHHGDSWVAAFDKVSGQMLWKVARNYETPNEGDQGYSTPILVRHQGRDCVLVWGAEHLTAYDPADGRLLWSCGGFNPGRDEFWPTIASPLVAGDKVIVAAGRSDRGQPRLHGVQLGGQGDVTATSRVWNRQDTGTFVPTPAEYRGRVYLLRDRGEIECIDPETGKALWQGALPKTSLLYYASPTIAGDKLYAAREDGTIFVVRIVEKFEILSQNGMGERVIASPVPVLNRLLIRGEKHLFSIGGYCP
jgi:outer membrane protein assembly factor BamB